MECVSSQAIIVQSSDPCGRETVGSRILRELIWSDQNVHVLQDMSSIVMIEQQVELRGYGSA